MAPRFSTADNPIPLYLVRKDAGLPGDLPAPARAFAEASGFEGKAGQALALPGADGQIVAALAGFSDAERAERFQLAAVADKLPEGDYRLVGDLTDKEANEAALGWLLGMYRFDRYADQPEPKARLVAPERIDAKRIETIATGVYMIRDLINTPAQDMGPEDLETVIHDLGEEFGAEVTSIVGDQLLTENFPMIHAVGRAAPQAPRLIELNWGDSGPRVTLVGKGICFDTGGLNLKPGSSMGLMKKDMGGAANAIGLAGMIMSLGLNVRLRLLIPAAENAIDGDAFRPQDILNSRKGLTVEINNTDAEGRLVLADALAYADESENDLILCMATLTGAARVALGPDIHPFYSSDPSLGIALAQAANDQADPIWEMPFWPAYEDLIEPGIADLDNAPKGGMAGSITAALFLKRFVTNNDRFAHFDIYGWVPSSKPGRPKGGEAHGVRAMLQVIENL
ncbi:leucyl aminopeptidase family protein [Paracoccaceae bacterium GXU_MW_L88]